MKYFIYADLIQQIGLTSARLYFEAHLRAMEDMKQIIKDLSIDCRLIEQDAYLYTVSSYAVVRPVIPPPITATSHSVSSVRAGKEGMSAVAFQ